MPQIPVEYMVALGAAAAGYLVLTLVLGRPSGGEGEKTFRKMVADRYFNTFLIFVLGWKLSPLVFQTSTVLAAPTALLYLPGGFFGSLLGLSLAAGYLFWVLVDPRKRTPAESLPRLRKTLGAGTGSLVLAAFLFSLLAASLPAPAPEAPDFSAPLREGGTVNLSGLRGKPVVLNFWASWCPPCRAEFPEMADFQEKAGTAAVLLAVNAATTEKRLEDAETFLQSQRVNFPVALDLDGRIQRAYGVSSLPTTVIVDSLGRIVWRRTGAISSEMLSQALSQQK